MPTDAPAIGPQERAAALAELAAMERELGQMAGWLDGAGYERAAVLLEDAQRSLLAVQCLIDRDARRVLALVPHGRLTGRADGRAWGT